MFRPAIVLLSRRSTFQLVTASFGVGGTIAATLTSHDHANNWSLKLGTNTQCSSTGNESAPIAPMSSLSITAASIESVSNEFTQYCSLIVPTLQALLRATRLVATAAIMAGDYEINSIQKRRPDSGLCRLYKWTFLSNDAVSQRHEKEVIELENAITHLNIDLEKAQHEYVSSDSSEGTANSRKETMMKIANDLSDAQEALNVLHLNGGTANNLHKRNARRLLELCRNNGGVYIKVGQHLANLDLLLPDEYIQTLSSLFDDAPASSYEDVCQVVKEEIGSSPHELFDDFSIEPFASASLAQVHTARCKYSGKKLAIKVQHRGLRDTSKGDLLAMATVVKTADKLFDEFNFGWICEELTPQLPKELDFVNEGKNAEAAAAHLSETGLDCVIPKVLWDYTGHRVLTMEFEEGFRATDVERIENAGMKRQDVARLISSIFNAQIFQNGFVHCDPHEANVMLREHPQKKGKPQIVLVDHGLYKKLDEDFQEAYARLWKGIVVADIQGIQNACHSLGVQKMYPLLASMLTSRPFDEVIERSQTGSFDASKSRHANQVGGDKAVIRGYAQRYIKEIISMLDIVPRKV